MLCQQAINKISYATIVLPSRRYADSGFIKCDLYIDTACVDPGGSTLVERVSPVRSHLGVLLILLGPVTQMASLMTTTDWKGENEGPG